MREDPSTNAEDKSTNVSISGTPLEHLWNKTIASLGNRYGDLYQISGGPLCHLWNTSRVFLYTGRHPADIPQISFFSIYNFYICSNDIWQTSARYRLCHLWNTSGTPLAEVYQRCDYFFSNSTTKHYFQQCAASQPCARPPRSAPNH